MMRSICIKDKAPSFNYSVDDMVLGSKVHFQLALKSISMTKHKRLMGFVGDSPTTIVRDVTSVLRLIPNDWRSLGYGLNT